MKLSHQIRIAQFANTIGADVETDVDALIRAVEALEAAEVSAAYRAAVAEDNRIDGIRAAHRRAQAAESEVARLRATDVGTLKARLDGALAAFEPWKRRAVKAEAEVRGFRRLLAKAEGPSDPCGMGWAFP